MRPKRNEIGIGKRIRERRLQLGIKSSTLAEYLGVTRGAVSGWEHSWSHHSLEQVAKMAEALCCTTDYLVLGKRNLADVIDRIRDIIDEDRL